MSDVKPDFKERDLCFLDTETTGLVFGHHEIIDLAAIRTTPEGDPIGDPWQTRIRPRHPHRVTTRAAEHNGFNTAEWARAPYSSRMLWESLADFAQGCIAVCHNPSFDRAFVQLEAGRFQVTNLGLDYHWLGTESLAWALLHRNQVSGMRLETILDGFGLEPEPEPHTALGGAESCRSAYLALMGLLAS